MVQFKALQKKAKAFNYILSRKGRRVFLTTSQNIKIECHGVYGAYLELCILVDDDLKAKGIGKLRRELITHNI